MRITYHGQTVECVKEADIAKAIRILQGVCVPVKVSR